MQKLKDVRVIIIEDHSIFIEGLSNILAKNELQVEAAFTHARDALSFLQSRRVDAVFLDISLPDLPGAEVCKQIKMLHPDTKVLALTNHTEKSVIMEMLQSGADGYLLKNTTQDELLDAIVQVLENRFRMQPELQQLLFAPEKHTDGQPRLTQRELEVLKLVGEGATTQAIAGRLFISPQTVETHRRNLMQKFKVGNTAALIKKAADYNLLS